jgi:hypothetical protein
MSTKKTKKPGIPLSPEDAIIIKSHAACIPVHYVEDDMETLEISEIIYKKVTKEMLISGGREILCYNDDGAYYECGANGEIKGLIKND